MHPAALVIVCPLLASILNAALIWADRRLCYPVTVLGLAGGVAAAGTLMVQVAAQGAAQYRLGGWSPPMGIPFEVDLLNSLVILLVSAVAFVNILASRRSIHQDLTFKDTTFYSLYLLFVTGLLGVTITGDLFNLYVLLEITSLTSYAMIAMGNSDRAPVASLNYVFIGVIGASFYLLGVGYLYIMTGSLNMADVATMIPGLADSLAIQVAFVFCLVGVWIKMALFPLHVWLPNAYTYAPPAASQVMAPLMTKVMVYVMIRLMLTVFGADFTFTTLDVSQFVVWLATAAILAGSVMALAQQNLMRMIAYIIVAEIGYMVGGAWLGNQAGMTGTILHIVNDALMTFGLLLAAGSIAYTRGTLKISSLNGMFSSMPWTMSGFVLAGMSIIGVPPTCGFFSKWYLILGGLEAHHYGFVAALVLSSLISAILFFRVIEVGFFPETSAGGHGDHHQLAAVKEGPISMLVSLGVVCVGLIAVGLASQGIVNTFILPFLNQGLM